jgi:hypothetical protein
MDKRLKLRHIVDLVEPRIAQFKHDAGVLVIGALQPLNGFLAHRSASNATKSGCRKNPQTVNQPPWWSAWTWLKQAYGLE